MPPSSRANSVVFTGDSITDGGGTNDIGGNIGPVPLESTEHNLAAMAELAASDGIKVIMASVMPVCDLPGKPPMTPARPRASSSSTAGSAPMAPHPDLPRLLLRDEKGMLRADITEDGLHPTGKGYELMNPLAEKAIAQAVRQ